jgi:hypothetical protein
MTGRPLCRPLPHKQNSEYTFLVVAAVDLLQLEVLVGDEVQRALLKAEPDHTLQSERRERGG